MGIKRICLILSLIMLCSAFFGCGNISQKAEETSPDSEKIREQLPVSVFDEDYGLSAAVLYSGGESWQSTVDYLSCSPMLGLKVCGVRFSDEAVLEDYDVIYVDQSLAENFSDNFADKIEDYAKNGGAVFLPNAFVGLFCDEMLGISAVKKIDSICEEPEYPGCNGDIGALQKIIEDFSKLYKGYSDYAELSCRDYGMGFDTESAVSLVKWNGASVYAINKYGEGTVFVTNPLLPNFYSASSFTMEKNEDQTAFASTTAGFNQLIYNGFAEYIAKEKYGYVLERSYGYFGTPSMSWELHYEEITGIANGSLQIFSEICEEYDQIPSFTLIRNSYTWFQRAESVTYLLNKSQNGMKFDIDLNESAYSSGTHVDAGGQWLSITKREDSGSYFKDYPEYKNRAYPYVSDINGDGNADIICGSEDGHIYCYEGIGFENGRLKVKGADVLKDLEGEYLRLGNYSAPSMCDLDSDGISDLICGWDDGTVRWFKGYGYTVFEPMGVLISGDIKGQVLPTMGDLNGDGTADLVLGSDKGSLMIYYGKEDGGRIKYDHFNASSLTKVCVNGGLGDWLAPAVADLDGDGKSDIAVGVFDGYVAVLTAKSNGKYSFDGYITADEMNYKGNSNIKFGNWSSPCFYDLDGNSSLDLICGSQEYGMAYPIDSEYFPYRKELSEQIDYVKEHDYYMGVHFYTNSYASPEREAFELSAHRKAMEFYGLRTDLSGANQHTWYTSSLSPCQTMSSIYSSGLYWQSGFASPSATATAPQVAAENVLALPFFLSESGRRTTLVQNNSVLLYSNEDNYEISARYGMPICIYYHCDFAYESSKACTESVEAVQRFREEYGYNFNREDQLMLASAAAIYQDVEVSGSLGDSLNISLARPTEDYDLYDESVYNSLGVKLIFSERINAQDFTADADVWYKDGNVFVLGLNRGVCVKKSSENDGEMPHLSRINMAADINVRENGAVINFLSGGMMEAAVRGEASTDTPGFTVKKSGGETIFTKFGSNESLNIIFEEAE